MATIELSDVIFATATIGGITLASIAESGFSSVGEVVGRIRRSAAVRRTAPGLVTITLRNSTQGWAQRRSVYF